MAKILNVLLSIAIVHATSVSAFAAPERAEIYLAPDEVRAKTFAYSKGLIEISETLQSQYFDVDVLAESLGYDLDRVVDFVVSNIAYSPYLGLMRGPSGTLSTESGSAWDQAVTLAALINATGGESMLGLGTLSEPDAKRLLVLAVDSQATVSSPLDAIDWEAKFRDGLGVDPIDFGDATDVIGLDDYTDAAHQISKNLQQALAEKDVRIGRSDQARTEAYLAAIASDYVWVRYRDTPNDPWLEAHPAFGDAVAPSVDVVEYIASTVPQDRLHRVGIKFEIEVQQGDSFQRKPISAEYVKPAANLSATQIQLGIAPNRPFEEGKSTYFLPSIDGQIPDRGMAFDLMGNLLSPEDAASGPEIFRTVGSRVGSAIDALADDDESQKAPRLTGVLMTITQILPGGARIEEVRRLTDFRDGRPNNPAVDIVFDGVLEVDVGAENGVRNMKALLESSAVFVRQLPYQLAYIAGDMTGTEYMMHPAFETQSSHKWLSALSSDLLFSHVSPNTLTVRSAPLVMVKRNMVSPASGFVMVIDIQHNETLSLERDRTGAVSLSAQQALAHGIRDTLVEGELIGVSEIADWTKHSKGIVIASEDELSASSIWQTSTLNQRDRLTHDLRRAGFLFVPEGSSRHWWRINPETGVVLGMSEFGGAEFTEQLVLILEVGGVMLSVYTFTNGMLSGADACRAAKAGQNFSACCIVGITVANMAVAGAGIASAGALGFVSATGAVYGITFDVVTGLVSTVGDYTNAKAIGVCSSVFVSQ